MLHSDCVNKIMNLGGNENIKVGMVEIFKAVVNDASSQGLPSGTCIVPFYDEHSGLKPGDWAAELHFVARQVESVDEQA